MKSNFSPIIRTIITMILGIIAIASLLRINQPSVQKGQQEYIVFFRETADLIKAKYVEPIDEKKLMESAINGMLASLDPHNAYMPPDAFNDMQVQLSGSFGGLGIEITIREGKLTVISPIEDTPAFRAGIKPGDHIWMIDNLFTRSMNISDAVKRMRGPKGSTVVLTVIRDGVAKPIVFRLKRDIIHIQSVKARTLDRGFGYVRVAQFQETTGMEFTNALESLKKDNEGSLKGLILDLRNNPGGLVDTAIDVAGHFVGGGLNDGLIVTMKGRDPSSKKEIHASVSKKELNYPVVVMINGGSASASEIVAGALQDYKRAVIVGTQSFGKGSVQSVIPMRNGAGLKLTTARYYTPKGRSIQVKGITPDIFIDEAETGKPVKKDDGEFREKDLDRHILPPDHKESGKNKTTPVPHSPADETNIKDYQLSRALELLKGMNLLVKENESIWHR